MDGKIVGIVAIVCVFGLPVVLGVFHILSSTWLNAVNHARDTELKHRLLEAGMSANEIAQVMDAGRHGSPVTDDVAETDTTVGAPYS